MSHGENAVNFDLSRLEAGQLPRADQGSRLYVYCLSGARAKAAKVLLEQAGYRVESLGGINDLPKYGINIV